MTAVTDELGKGGAGGSAFSGYLRGLWGTWTKEFGKGLWKEIPPFRFVLGLCPALACSDTVEHGFGMGLMLAFVVTGSNLLISALRKIIPDEVRIACYIVIVATFVTCVELVMKAYFFSLSEALGIYIPLIVVNCIPLGRAEAFAKKNGTWASFADGLGMGLGYTMSLTALGVFRELFGTGKLVGYQIMPASFQPFEFLQQAPGAFVALGLMLGIMNFLGKKK
jgi:electron transport complex protein RnfE